MTSTLRYFLVLGYVASWLRIVLLALLLVASTSCGSTISPEQSPPETQPESHSTKNTESTRPEALLTQISAAIEKGRAIVRAEDFEKIAKAIGAEKEAGTLTKFLEELASAEVAEEMLAKRKSEDSGGDRDLRTEEEKKMRAKSEAARKAFLEADKELLEIKKEGGRSLANKYSELIKSLVALHKKLAPRLVKIHNEQVRPIAQALMSSDSRPTEEELRSTGFNMHTLQELAKGASSSLIHTYYFELKIPTEEIIKYAERIEELAKKTESTT